LEAATVHTSAMVHATEASRRPRVDPCIPWLLKIAAWR
jgi:hypothetical protein